MGVTGEGNQPREIAVPDEQIAALQRYLVARGLDPDLDTLANQDVYLVGRAVDVGQRTPWSPLAQQQADPRVGIAGSTLYDALKGFFTKCAAVLAATDEKGALRLQAASTHWLRHTHASHAIAAQVPLDVVQDRLGHASPATTAIYVTSEDRRKMQALQKMFPKTNRT